MPHLILETTADLPENANIPDILLALGVELATFESVSSASIKAYHTLRSVWCMGDGAPPGFAHLTVAVLSGRTLEWRQDVGQRLHQVLSSHMTESLAADEVSVTVELREMVKETYFK